MPIAQKLTIPNVPPMIATPRLPMFTLLALTMPNTMASKLAQRELTSTSQYEAKCGLPFGKTELIRSTTPKGSKPNRAIVPRSATEPRITLHQLRRAILVNDVSSPCIFDVKNRSPNTIPTQTPKTMKTGALTLLIFVGEVVKSQSEVNKGTNTRPQRAPRIRPHSAPIRSLKIRLFSIIRPVILTSESNAPVDRGRA